MKLLPGGHSPSWSDLMRQAKREAPAQWILNSTGKMGLDIQAYAMLWHRDGILLGFLIGFLIAAVIFGIVLH